MRRRLVGIFTGADGSMGFKRGKPYRFATSIENGHLKITTQEGLYCYYQNLETLLDNWQIVPESALFKETVNGKD